MFNFKKNNNKKNNNIYQFDQWVSKDPQDVLKGLDTSQTGLSEKEAKIRLSKDGSNAIKVKEGGLFDILLRQFKSSFIYLLIVAAIVSFAVGEISNGIIILIFVSINILLGFYQEARAFKAASMLSEYLQTNAKVLRGGKEVVINKDYIVPGDIVILYQGDMIPADLRLLEVNNFSVDESVLTGESVPVVKDFKAIEYKKEEISKAGNIGFTGTFVISGNAKGIVVATGTNTVLGKIAKTVSNISIESGFEKSLMKFSKIILRIVLITIVTIFIANIIIKGTSDILDFSLFCIALIIGIIPEALPVVVTFAFSQGALTLAKEKVIIKRLSAIEELGNIEVICLDKTGTITENKLTLEDVVTNEKDTCLLYGLLSPNIIRGGAKLVSNPFDLAIVEKTPDKILKQLKEFKIVSEVPFDPSTRISCLVVENAKEKFLIVKGAPEFILEKSSSFVGNFQKKDILSDVESMGENGKRVLAIAFKKLKDEQDSKINKPERLNFLGYFSFKDPLKRTSKTTINLAQQLGVQVKILTGDSAQVAGAVAKEVGLIKYSNDVILGEEIDRVSGKKLQELCERYSVFARVSPFTKYKIIETLKNNYDVGFLGEGINDTPALKLANVGICVKEAVDIARKASDIMLLRKDLRVIITGIKQGRAIFSNVNKYIKCTLASNFGNYYSMALIALIIPFLPLLPIQVLLVNLLSDFPLIAIVYDRVDLDELKTPKLYKMNQMILLIIFLSLVSTVYDFIFLGLFRNSAPEVLRTLWFIESILTEIVLIFSIRTSGFFAKASFPGIPLFFTTIFALIITFLFPISSFGQEFFYFVIPSKNDLLIIFSIAIAYFITSEVVKLIYFKMLQNKSVKKQKI